MAKDLNYIAKVYGTTKRGNSTNYVRFYKRSLAPFRNKHINLLEIGIDRGYSIRMWLEYFKFANIYCMDSFKKPHFDGDKKETLKYIEHPRCFPMTGDQGNPKDLQKL